MKALNKKDRQNAIFKFSLIYALSILFLGFLFWQISYVPKKVEGGTGTVSVKSSDFEKLKKESEFLKSEISRAQDFIEASMGSLEYADEKILFYFEALRKSGEEALLNKDVRNNKQVAGEIIDSMTYELKDGYTLKELPLENKESAEKVIEQSLRHFDKVMKAVVFELRHRNNSTQEVVEAADNYFSCMGSMAKIDQAGGNCGKQIQEYEFNKGLMQSELTERTSENYDLKAQLQTLKEQVGSGASSSKELQDCETDLAACESKRATLKIEIEKTEKAVSVIASKLKGKGDKGEERDLNELEEHLFDVRSKN